MSARSKKIPPPVPTIDKFDSLLSTPKQFIEDDLGIKLPKLEPDKKKLEEAMKKAKPAEFFITLEGDKFGFEVRAGAYKQSLAQINLAAEKNNDVAFEIRRALSHPPAALLTEKELEQWNNKHLTSAQTGFYHDMVSEYQPKVDKLKKITQALANPTYEHLDPLISKDFHDWAQAHSRLHYVTFLEDLDAKADPKATFEKYMKQGAQYPVNVGAKITGDIEKALTSNQTPDFTAARAQVLKVVNQALLPTFKKEKLPGYQKDLAHDSQYLETIKKTLKDAGEAVP